MPKYRQIFYFLLTNMPANGKMKQIVMLLYRGLKMRKQIHKLLATVLSIIMILSVVPTTSYASELCGCGIVGRLGELRAKFPDGKYWNHLANSYHNNDGPYNTCTNENCMNPDSYTDTPCTTHNGFAGVGCYDCNNFDSGIQCFGFANKIFYDVFGVYASQMQKRYDFDNISIGDWIRVNNDSHSAVVIDRSGSNLTVVEANYGTNCMIQWNRTININTVTYYKHASNWSIINEAHSYGEWQTVIEANCVEEGSKKRVCSYCGNTQVEAIPLLEHTWSDWEITTSIYGPEIVRHCKCGIAQFHRLSENCTINNAKENISVIPLQGGNLPETAEVKVEKTKADDKHVTYEIHLENNGVEVQPQTPVLVKLPIPDWFDRDKLNIYRKEADGSRTRLDYIIYGDFAYFETDHFSVYEILEKLCGDINSDNSVNNKDLTRLFKYLSGWDVDPKEEMLDINGDGKVNNKDLTRLFQYLSGWAVDIF